MYPNTPGARFNHDYYRDKHMPLVKSLMGDSCKYYTVDKGLGGGAPDTPATYVGMCHIFCDSIASAVAKNGASSSTASVAAMVHSGTSRPSWPHYRRRPSRHRGQTAAGAAQPG